MSAALEKRCQEVAIKRNIEAARRRRVGLGGAPATGPLALKLNEVGARAEGIAWDWLGQLPRWNDLADRITGLPDLQIGDLKIDAKGIEQPHHSLIVQTDDSSDWAYLLVAREFRSNWYQIQGWLWGHEAKTYPLRQLRDDRIEVHVVGGDAKAKLRCPSTLAWLVTGRREK
jgi:hypothetical protein